MWTPVKIIGVLSWYDESPSWLATCVAGFGQVCDVVVAVDGAYSLYPQARSHSFPDQREAIMAAAEAVGAGCILYQPQTVWYGNEVEKRNATLDLVRTVGVEMEDWVIVFDGDHQAMQVHPDTIREVLSQTEHHVATFTWIDGRDLLAEPDEAEMAKSIDISTQWTIRNRGVFRLVPGLRYEVKHWNVLGEVDGETVCLWGPQGRQLIEEARLEAALVVYHRRASRALVRNRAAEEYYHVRDAAGVEGGDLVAAA